MQKVSKPDIHLAFLTNEGTVGIMPLHTICVNAFLSSHRAALLPSNAKVSEHGMKPVGPENNNWPVQFNN
jgi:hypothetical protein